MKITNKLHYQNDWEYDIYTVNGKNLTNLTEVEIGNVKYKVTSRQVSVPCYDMGHTYDVTSLHYFIKVPLLGVAVDLNQLVNKKKVTATKFKTGNNENEI